jgi:tRNA A-37 threonylcarbamoyl transferase component Bud32
LKSDRFEYQEPISPESGGLLCERRAELREARAVLARGGFLTVNAAPHSGVTTFLWQIAGEQPRVAWLDLANHAFSDNPMEEAALNLAQEIERAFPEWDAPSEPRLISDVLNAWLRSSERRSDRLLVVVDGFDTWSDDLGKRLALSLRAAYTEARSFRAEEVGRLSILCGSALDLRDLTATARTSPLNIAHHVFLPDFSKEDVSALMHGGLTGHMEDSAIQAWAEYAYYWAGGHPALTQYLGHQAWSLHAEGLRLEDAHGAALPLARDLAADWLSSPLEELARMPDLREMTVKIYSSTQVRFDRILRPMRALLNLGLLTPSASGQAEPRNRIFETVLNQALDLSSSRILSFANWKPSPVHGLELEYLTDLDRTTELHAVTRTLDSMRVAAVLEGGGRAAHALKTGFSGDTDFVPAIPYNEDGEAGGSATTLTQIVAEDITAQVPLAESNWLGPGKVLGGCRLERLLGRGGMGEVYLARHLALDTMVALKILRSDSHEDKRVAQRFLREARAAAQLQHEHIVSIRNVGRDGEYRYIEMEYIQGGSLADLLDQAPYQDMDQALRWLLEAAAGIHAAHQKGIIHRDLKPDNLMKTADDRIKVVDFGLAAIHSLDGTRSRLTVDGTIMGTPHYMAPEQWVGRRVDERTDVYSLGATFYHLLAGRPPFQGRTIMELATEFANGKIVPPHERNPFMPRAFSDLLMKMLARELGERYADMEHVLQALDQLRP